MSGAGENNKLLILAGGRRNFGSANKLRESLLGNGRESLIVTDLCLKNYEAPHVRTIKYYRDLFNIKYEESRKDCHDFINLAEELKIDERSTFKDLVTYKGVSLWKMSATYLLFELSPLLEDYRLSCEIVNFEKPGEIIILDDSGKLGNIFRAICLNRGVPLKTVKTGISLQPVKKYVSYLEYFLRN